MKKIFLELDEVKKNYAEGKTERFDGLYRSPWQVIKMCEYYSSSRYLTVTNEGKYNKDGMGRDKPFYNIVNYRVALAKTATDLDIKDIQIVADNPKHQVESMLLNHECYEWMKEANFSLTLNKMGSTRPKYGGYLAKKTMVDGKLKIDVLDWTKVYTDPINIMGGPIVECHYMSPVDLKKKDGVWENIDDVLGAYYKQKSKEKIEVYECLGYFSECLYNDFYDIEEKADDEYTYTLQKYFIAQVGAEKFPLYCEKPSGEISDYYEYLSWEDQSLDLGRGVIEDSEEAQVWTNDSVINEKLAMDLAGKASVVTTSKKMSGNILEVDHGKIFEVEPNSQTIALNLTPAALGQYQNQIEKWKSQADNVTNSYDAATGQQPPSGTPYSQTALLNRVATKPFDYKRQEWGIHLSEIFNKWVIPYLIKKIKAEHILVSEYSDVELQQIDDAFAIEQSNQDMIKKVISGQNVTPEEQAQSIDTYKNHIKGQGKKRYIEVPKDYFSDIEAKVTVVTTGEQKDKGVILTSLNTILQTVVSSFNPNTGKFGVLEDPTLKRVFDEIIEVAGSGISPISLGLNATKAPSTPSPMPSMPSPMQPALATNQ